MRTAALVLAGVGLAFASLSAVHQSTGRPYIYNVADETGPGKQDAAGAYLRSRHIRQIAPQRVGSSPK